MAAVRLFECAECGSEGKITVKGDEVTREDIVYCPVCGCDIWEEEDLTPEND